MGRATRIARSAAASRLAFSGRVAPLACRAMQFVTFTEFETDNPIHINADKVVAVKFADHATQVLCSELLTFFVKDPPEQVLKDLRAARRET